ncbi:hypothetical protein C8R44DRAFT_752973 [Mycena epipterygia]|nr:hypothetical protein C8R44DRAFT_752973 [Mycena epipterygia]
MHTVVEIIPLLLHASLLFFFGGLVAFLIPVNVTMTAIATALLLIVAAVYSILTLLPLRYLDCPYRTPLSGTSWQVLKTFKRIWPQAVSRVLNTLRPIWRSSDSDPHTLGGWLEHQGHFSPPENDTMVEAIFRAALDPHRRSKRDYRALVWTMKSLADEVELEPFVEAIPDLLWGPDGMRRGYSEHILRLVHDPDIRLDNRITALLDSCHTGLLSADDSKRRLISCYNAFWAIASLAFNPAESFTGPNATVDFSRVCWSNEFRRSASTPEITPYFNSAKAVMCWSMFCALGGSSTMSATQKALSIFDINKPDWSQLKPLENMYRALIFTPHQFHIQDPEPILQRYQRMFDRLSGLPSEILFNYLTQSACLSPPPYQWERTLSLVSDWSNPEEVCCIGHGFEECLEIVINTWQEGSVTASDVRKKPWIDKSIVLALLRFWCAEEPADIPNAIIQLLNHSPDFDFHSPDDEFGDMLVSHLWSSFFSTLTFQNPISDSPATRAMLTALWNLASLHSIGVETGVRVLDALYIDSSFAMGHLPPLPQPRGPHGVTWLPWLDDPAARNQIKEIFRDYLRELQTTIDAPADILNRLRTLLQKLDSWNPRPHQEYPLQYTHGGGLLHLREGIAKVDGFKSGQIKTENRGITPSEDAL